MKQWNKYSSQIIFLFAALIYANTIGHDFVLDDKIVITHNQFTKKGLNGIAESFTSDSMTGFFGKDKKLVAGGRYRPLTMAIHAIEYEFFGNDPLPYHAINILLYALIAMMLFKVLLRLIPPEGEVQLFSLAGLATLIYIAHPLHTEVVANIKSQDELLSVLFAVLAWWTWLKIYADSSLKKWLLPSALLFLSLMSKESTISFVLLIPLSGIMILGHKVKNASILGGSLVLAALAYVALRYSVIGSAKLDVAKELMNNPFLNANSSEKFATIFLTYLEYFKLLIFPHPLTHDYYPKHIPIVDWSNLKVILSLLIHAGLIFLAFLKRKDQFLIFWIIFYFASFFLYSNLLFNIGTFMNERFMFVSSLAYCVLFAYLLKSLLQKQRSLMTGAMLIVTLGYAALSIARNPDWESDRSLALADVEVSSNSAKAQMAAGSAYLDWARDIEVKDRKGLLLNKSIKHLQTSLEIYPGYFPPTILMANALAEAGRYSESVAYYRKSFQMNPKHAEALNNTLYVAQQAALKKDFQSSIAAYNLLLTQEQKADYYSAIGEIYGKELGDLQRSLDILDKGLNNFPENADLLQKAGVVKAMQGKPSEALSYFLKALEFNPDNGHLHLNIGIAYRSLGRVEESERYIQKALELEPSLRKG